MQGNVTSCSRHSWYYCSILRMYTPLCSSPLVEPAKQLNRPSQAKTQALSSLPATQGSHHRPPPPNLQHPSPASQAFVKRTILPVRLPNLGTQFYPHSLTDCSSDRQRSLTHGHISFVALWKHGYSWRRADSQSLNSQSGKT